MQNNDNAIIVTLSSHVVCDKTEMVYLNQEYSAVRLEILIPNKVIPY